jgi:hypothetical protein
MSLELILRATNDSRYNKMNITQFKEGKVTLYFSKSKSDIEEGRVVSPFEFECDRLYFINALEYLPEMAAKEVNELGEIQFKTQLMLWNTHREHSRYERIRITQFKEGMVDLTFAARSEDDGEEIEPFDFVCDRVELIKNLKKLPELVKVMES